MLKVLKDFACTAYEFDLTVFPWGSRARDLLPEVLTVVIRRNSEWQKVRLLLFGKVTGDPCGKDHYMSLVGDLHVHFTGLKSQRNIWMCLREWKTAGEKQMVPRWTRMGRDK